MYGNIKINLYSRQDLLQNQRNKIWGIKNLCRFQMRVYKLTFHKKLKVYEV